MDVDTWKRIASFLAAVEARYRKERLRTGPDAKRLPAEEEKVVAGVVRRACELYLRAGDEERAEMRRFFAASYSLPWRLLWASGDFAVEGELRLALAALSLEDGVTDCRETYLAFMAIQQSIDIDTIVREVAALSSPRMRTLLLTGALNMKDFRS